MSMEKLKDYLTKELYNAECHENGDVLFWHDSVFYYVEADADDENAFRICAPSFVEIENKEPQAYARSLAFDLSGVSRCAKLIMHDSQSGEFSVDMYLSKNGEEPETVVVPNKDVTGLVGMYMPDIDSLISVFLKYFTELNDLVTNFKKELQDWYDDYEDDE